MGEIRKNIDEQSNQALIVPPTLRETKKRYEDANFSYTYDGNDRAYIEFYTLCQARKDTVRTQVIKAYKLLDRETEEKEYLVYFKHTTCKDASGLTVDCPVDEIVGLLPDPDSDKIRNNSNQLVDIKTRATKNDYTLEATEENIKKMFSLGKNSHKIVCYVGYTKEDQTKSTGFIEEKKIIPNQEAFVTKSAKELLSKDPVFNQKKTFRDDTKPQDVNISGDENDGNNNNNTGEIQGLKNLKELIGKGERHNAQVMTDDQGKGQSSGTATTGLKSSKQNQSSGGDVNLEQELDEVNKAKGSNKNK